MDHEDGAAVGRFQVVVEEGAPRGDLYELERRTTFRVVDRHRDQVVATFEGTMEASLSRDTGLWDDYSFSGVCEVAIAADERFVHVKYCDGHEEWVPLPE